MEERPIIFNAEMVKAIMEGRKTQTRRVVKPQPPPHHWEDHPYHYISLKLLDTDSGYSMRFQHILCGIDSDCPFWVTCPYGKPGDRLWVRETWTMAGGPDGTYDAAPNDGRPCWPDDLPVQHRAFYRATEPGVDVEEFGWTPSIHMPRWASRISLEITDIRVERVQDISDHGPQNDCTAEGVFHAGLYVPTMVERKGEGFSSCEKMMFRNLWDSINGQKPGRAWADNPWVWVVSFKRVSA